MQREKNRWMALRENIGKRGKREVKSSETASKSAASAGNVPQKPLDECDTQSRKSPLWEETLTVANPGWESDDHDRIEPSGREIRVMLRSNIPRIPLYLDSRQSVEPDDLGTTSGSRSMTSWENARFCQDFLRWRDRWA